MSKLQTLPHVACWSLLGVMMLGLMGCGKKDSVETAFAAIENAPSQLAQTDGDGAEPVADHETENQSVPADPTSHPSDIHAMETSEPTPHDEAVIDDLQPTDDVAPEDGGDKSTEQDAAQQEANETSSEDFGDPLGQSPPMDIPHDTERNPVESLDASDTSVTHFAGRYEDSRRRPRVSPEVQAINQVIDELLTLEDVDLAATKLQILFQAAEREREKYEFAAIHAAKRVVVEDRKSVLAQNAQAFLLRLSFQDSGATDPLFRAMARFACDYPQSELPVLLYRELSNDLTTQGQGGAALALLKHGIRECESHRDVVALKNQRKATLHNISILGRVATEPRKPSRPQPDSTAASAAFSTEQLEKDGDNSAPPPPDAAT